jgi:hypothetical protein
MYDEDDNRWEMRAKCANDPEVQAELSMRIDRFHDQYGNQINSENVQKYCGNCPVKEQCLARAMELANGTDHMLKAWGIWGGTTMKQRSFATGKAKRRKVEVQAATLQMIEQLKEQFPGSEDPIAS